MDLHGHDWGDAHSVDLFRHGPLCQTLQPHAGDVLRKVRKVWCFQRAWSVCVFLVIFGNKTSSALFFPKTCFFMGLYLILILEYKRV